MTDTTNTSYAWKAKQRKGLPMREHTKLGIFLLAPPIILWVAVITFMFDQTLGEYVFSKFTPNSLDATFFITGMIFPGAAIAAAAWGLHKKQDLGANVSITLLAVLFLTLVAMQMFM
jgi:hypothetical protein